MLEEEREGQNGGSEPSGEDMLDLIQPATVPTPIFDTAEVVVLAAMLHATVLHSGPMVISCAEKHLPCFLYRQCNLC